MISEERGVSRTLMITAGVMFLAEGIIAYIAGLNLIGAIILVIIGVGGILAAFRRSRDENTP